MIGETSGNINPDPPPYVSLFCCC
uniref:Uncharacterized protein n=1 Tax=Rhizophora mucronata TaxID=61149 RepID=A0A2P2QD65_RHIMU